MKQLPKRAQRCRLLLLIDAAMALGLLLVLLPGGATSCSLAASRPAFGGTLRIVFAQPATTLDPAFSATLPERTLSTAVYETLTEPDERDAAAPSLALSWESEAGGRRWTIRLRPGVHFHNGNAVTADAVRASLERAVAQSPAVVAAELRRLHLSCAAAASDRLVCEASEAIPVLPALLADHALAIADADGSGTGPFRLTRFDGNHARLDAFDGYAKGRPFLDAVEAEFGVDARRQRIEFEMKRADAMAAPPTEARLPGRANVSVQLNVLVLSMRANNERELPPETRQAIATAVNREALARLLPPGRAEAAFGFLPAWLSGYEYLFTNGSPRNSPAPVLQQREYVLIHDDADPVARLIASRLALDLRPLGGWLRVEPVAHSGFAAARNAGQYDFCLESLPLGVNAGSALAGITRRYDLAPLSFDLYRPPGDSEALIELQYRYEKTALELRRAIPLIHFTDAYSFQPGIQRSNPRQTDTLDLANTWKSSASSTVTARQQ